MESILPLISYDTFGFATELLLATALLVVHEPRRPKFALRAALSCALVLCVALAVAALFNYGWLNLLRYALIFASATAGIYLSFDLTVHEALFFGLAAYNVQHIGWRVVGLTVYLSPSILSGFSATVASLPVMVAIALLFSRTLRANRDATVNNLQLIALVSVVILADLVLNYIPILLGGQGIMLSPTESVYAIICCLLTLAIQSGILVRSRLEHEQALLQELWKKNRDQYELAKRSIDVINTRSHDLKKQINVLLAASLEGSQESGTIREIQESIEAYDNKAKTGNPVLDVLLTQKLMEAQSQDTTLAYLIDGREFSFLDEVDLYALFGNVLDNALESVAHLNDKGHRVINLRAVRRGHLLVVHCENYAGEDMLLGADGLPRTTKPDACNHGFGLRSIRMVVEKYRGNMTVHTDDGVFHLQIVMPMPNPD